MTTMENPQKTLAVQWLRNESRDTIGASVTSAWSRVTSKKGGDSDCWIDGIFLQWYLFYLDIHIKNGFIDVTLLSLTVWTLELWTLWLFFHFFCTLFSLILYFSFYIFPELTNHIREPKQWHRHFFLLFLCFYICPMQRLRCFVVKTYK